MKIRTLIVDDSSVVRHILAREVSRDSEIEVVGMACDAFEARDMIVGLKPDVVTLDIEMPRMDGITFLRKLIRYYPLPVVVVSSLTRRGGDIAIEALDAGAVDFVCKPSMEFRLPQVAAQLREKLKAAYAAGSGLAAQPTPAAVQKNSLPPVSFVAPKSCVIAVGASTGGPQALGSFLTRMPANAPPILVVQHMPAKFTESFARRLDECCAMSVREAKDGDELSVGHVLVAPGDRHMILRKRPGGAMWVEIKEGPLVSGHRPSVDVLFRSTASVAGKSSIGIILTGMGSDGAEGMAEMRRAGARTIAQDEASSVVYGMPKEAERIGAADSVVSLEELPRALQKLLTARSLTV